METLTGQASQTRTARLPWSTWCLSARCPSTVYHRPRRSQGLGETIAASRISEGEAVRNLVFRVGVVAWRMPKMLIQSQCRHSQIRPVSPFGENRIFTENLVEAAGVEPASLTNLP